MPEESPKKDSKKRNIYIIGGGVVGLVVYLWYKHTQTTNAANALNATLPATGSLGGNAGNATTNLAANLPSITDLQGWMQAVQTWANSLGNDPALTQNALQHYGQGVCLSAAEFAILDKALGQFGSAPGAPFQGLVQCPQTTTNPPPTQPTPGGPNTSDIQFNYANDTQIQQFANVGGQLVHRWTGIQGGPQWASEILGTGLAPGANLAYTLNSFGQQGRIDVTGQNQDNSTTHLWYVPGKGWAKEILAPGSKAA